MQVFGNAEEIKRIKEQREDREKYQSICEEQRYPTSCVTLSNLYLFCSEN